jgi:hypothetical protein
LTKKFEIAGSILLIVIPGVVGTAVQLKHNLFADENVDSAYLRYLYLSSNSKAAAAKAHAGEGLETRLGT